MLYNPVYCRAALGEVADHMACAVYLCLLSLLRSVLDVRRCVELGNRLPGSYTIARNALIAAVVVLVLALLATLQQLTKVVRLRGERCESVVVHKLR